MFLCDSCSRFLWTHVDLSDGRRFCEICYDKYLIDMNRNITKKVEEIEKRGLFQIVYSLCEKYKNHNIPQDELETLKKLFSVKYEINIPDNILNDVVSQIKNIIDERNELNRFEKDLLSNNSKNLNFSKDKPFFCDFCNNVIDEKTYEYSKKELLKPLCRTHQGSKAQKTLFSELRKKGIDCEYEYYDGHKHIDIAIHNAKMYIEIDGPFHKNSVEQFISDGYRDEFSNKDGYFTKRIPINYIENSLDDITDAIKKTVEIRKNK